MFGLSYVDEKDQHHPGRPQSDPVKKYDEMAKMEALHPMLTGAHNRR